MVRLQVVDGGTAFSVGVAVNIDFIGTRRKNSVVAEACHKV